MSKAQEKRRLIATQRYMNRCSAIPGARGNVVIAWSWARRFHQYFRPDRGGPRVARWLPRH